MVAGHPEIKSESVDGVFTAWQQSPATVGAPGLVSAEVDRLFTSRQQ
jgi:hypothetical protein